MELGESPFSVTAFADDPIDDFSGAIAIDLFTQVAIAADLSVDLAIAAQISTQPD